MQQLALLADTPRSRRNDPETSHRAADRIKRRGMLAGHQHAIRMAVTERPGMTYREIAAHLGMEPVAVGRRLKELEGVWLVTDGERDGMRIWWPKCAGSK